MKTKGLKESAAILCVILCAFLCAANAQAATKIWVGTTSGQEGDWATAANWSPSGVPATGDNVYFENSSQAVDSNFNQSAVLLASLNISQSFTGYIGDDVNFLQIGATALSIGQYSGPGSPTGSGRIKLDLGTVQITAVIYNSGTPVTSTIPSILIKNTHVSSTIEIRKGKVGIAFNTGETSTISRIDISFVTQQASDAEVYIGSGVTLTTLMQTGGDNTLRCAATTVTCRGGTLTTDGSGAVTTMTVQGGTLTSNSTGTITTLTVKDSGIIDLTKSARARTVTTTKLDASGTIKFDPAVVTFTNKVISDNPVVYRAASS